MATAASPFTLVYLLTPKISTAHTTVTDMVNKVSLVIPKTVAMEMAPKATWDKPSDKHTYDESIPYERIDLEIVYKL